VRAHVKATRAALVAAAHRACEARPQPAHDLGADLGQLGQLDHAVAVVAHDELARLARGALAHVAVARAVVARRLDRHRPLRRHARVAVDEVEQRLRLEGRVLELDVARAHVAVPRLLQAVDLAAQRGAQLMAEAIGRPRRQIAALATTARRGVRERRRRRRRRRR